MQVYRIDGKDYVDWRAFGRDRYHVPRKIPTEVESCMTVVGSLVAAYGDLAVDPRSGGIIGQQAIARKIPMTERHARRTVLREPWIRWIGNVPATNVASLAAWGLAHQEQARAKHLPNLVQFRAFRVR
jgi:hypothetical protein